MNTQPDKNVEAPPLEMRFESGGGCSKHKFKWQGTAMGQYEQEVCERCGVTGKTNKLDSKALPVTIYNHLPREILLKLGTLVITSQMTTMMGTTEEAETARGVIAGIVASLKVILSPDQFRDVILQWEIDPMRLAELLYLAGLDEAGEIVGQ